MGPPQFMFTTQQTEIRRATSPPNPKYQCSPKKVGQIHVPPLYKGPNTKSTQQRSHNPNSCPKSAPTSNQIMNHPNLTQTTAFSPKPPIMYRSTYEPKQPRISHPFKPFPPTRHQNTSNTPPAGYANRPSPIPKVSSPNLSRPKPPNRLATLIHIRTKPHRLATPNTLNLK
ncbi:hypothetical protein G9A89_000683 [Geosiphon pyriformis]|nr:hypothetical protein G9A89_000683 [Geosiphon pyriformis]